ncbi:MAG: undecaprenyl-diphosphate phosphatase [Clostridia bacterium]|nr:undecaprenyl-diphosphate phosphatase [Clostridia bacterium]
MWREILTAVLFGILEGVTEWLPISSTGHLILLDRVLEMPLRPAVLELFEVVIQLGAILAVVVLFWHRLNPFSRKKSKAERGETFALWGKVLLATLPAAVVGFLLDDWMSERLYRPLVVAAALIVYGVAFLLLEKCRKRDPLTVQTADITPRIAFLVGCFQMLSLVPGTSRSGSTILGGILLGLSRPVAAEFSFFLGVPTMLGAGVLKGAKFLLEGNALTGNEVLLLSVGTLTAFLTSLVVIRFLMDFVRRHSFAGFGVYRILLGGAVWIASLLGIL